MEETTRIVDQIPWGKALVSLVAAVPLMLWIEATAFGDYAPRQPAPLVTESTDLVPEAAPIVYRSLEEIEVVFDPNTGTPQVWYSGSLEEEPRFFLRPGFDPATGEPLSQFSREELARYGDGLVAKEEMRHAEDLARRRARAVRDEAAWRERLVDTRGIAGFSGGRYVLVAIDDDAFTRAVASALAHQGLRVQSDIFRKGIFTDPSFEELSAGSRTIVTRLGLSAVDGVALLGRLSLEERKARASARLVTVEARLALSIVPLRGDAPKALTLTERGIGFDVNAAREQARARTLEQLLGHESLITVTR